MSQYRPRRQPHDARVLEALAAIDLVAAILPEHTLTIYTRIGNQMIIHGYPQNLRHNKWCPVVAYIKGRTTTYLPCTCWTGGTEAAELDEVDDQATTTTSID